MANAQVNIRFIENAEEDRPLFTTTSCSVLKPEKVTQRYCYCVNKECGARLNTKDEMVTKVSKFINIKS